MPCTQTQITPVHTDACTFCFHSHQSPSSFTSTSTRPCKDLFPPSFHPRQYSSQLTDYELSFAANELIDNMRQFVSVKSEQTSFNRYCCRCTTKVKQSNIPREILHNFVLSLQESHNICFHYYQNPITLTSIPVGFPWGSASPHPMQVTSSSSPPDDLLSFLKLNNVLICKQPRYTYYGIHITNRDCFLTAASPSANQKSDAYERQSHLHKSHLVNHLHTAISMCLPKLSQYKEVSDTDLPLLAIHRRLKLEISQQKQFSFKF